MCAYCGIALRSPCSAQALGGLPWPPVRRMRRTPTSAYFCDRFTHIVPTMRSVSIAEICSIWVIALRSPCSAQALGDHPWSPVRRMRRTLATAIITRTGSLVLGAKRGDVFRRDRRRPGAEARGDVIGEAGDFRVGIGAAEGRHGGARVGSLQMRAG